MDVLYFCRKYDKLNFRHQIIIEDFMLSLNSYDYLTFAQADKFSENSKSYFAWKDKSSLRYVNASLPICEMLQIPTLKDAIGKNDTEFSWQTGGHTHEFFTYIDKKVMDGNLYCNQRELILVANPMGQVVSRIVQVTKKPVMQNGKCYGIAFEGYDITQEMFPTLKNHVGTLHSIQTDEFTTREVSCIRLLLSGYSYQNMANKLYLSNRTIEYHIDKLKNRLNCKNKQQLIQKLLQMGFKPYS